MITDDMRTVITWRTSRPMDRDAICLHIVKYEWTTTSHQQFALHLDPEPHWHEFNDGETLPDATVELSGLDLILWLGRTRPNWPQDFDPRLELEERLDAKVKAAIGALMDLMPAVEFHDG